MVHMSKEFTLLNIKKFLHYDPFTGYFTWVKRGGRKAEVGSRAGSLREDGYIRIQVLKIPIYAHQLAFFYMTGSFPNGEIDHIDRNKSNNAWVNLRVATKSLNCANRVRGNPAASGFKGVQKNGEKYLAQITAFRTVIYLGTFDTAEEAHAAYLNKATEKFGQFASAS